MDYDPPPFRCAELMRTWRVFFAAFCSLAVADMAVGAWAATGWRSCGGGAVDPVTWWFVSAALVPSPLLVFTCVAGFVRHPRALSAGRTLVLLLLWVWLTWFVAAAWTFVGLLSIWSWHACLSNLSFCVVLFCVALHVGAVALHLSFAATITLFGMFAYS